MIDDKTRENLLSELVKHVNNGGNLKAKIAELKQKYPDEGKDFWKQLRKDVKEQTKDSGHEEQYSKVKQREKKKAITLINQLLSKFTFRGQSLGSGGYRKLPEIVEKLKAVESIDTEQLQQDLVEIERLLMLAGERAQMSRMREIVENISEKEFMGKDEEEDRLISMALQDFYIEFGKYNYMDADERKAMYIFWEKVQDEYPKLVSAVEDLKEALSKLRIDDENFQQLVNDLEAPPPYIHHIGTVKKSFKDPLQRFIAFLERLGAKRPKGGRTTYSRQNIRGKEGSEIIEDEEGTPRLHGEVRPELSQRLPEEHTTGRSDRVVELTREGRTYEEDIPLDTGMTDIELDPILWHIWNDLEVPAGFGDDLEDMLEQLKKLESLTGEEKRLADLAIDELETAVNDINEGFIYLPIAHWLKEFIPGITEDVAEVSEKTGRFFGVLNRLFLESGILPVYMGTKHGGPKRGAAGGAIEISGKTDAQQFRRPRVSGDMDTLPEEKEDKHVKAVEKEWKELKELLNSYYFHPISKGEFVDDDKPDFTDLGGHDYDKVKEGEDEPLEGEFDPDRTTQEGRYPYRALELEIGTHPKAQTLKRLLAALDDNMFDTDLLESLIELITMLKGGFESVEGWNRYVSQIEEHVKHTLDKLLPDLKRENRIWAAGKIGEALIASHERPLLSEIELLGKPIDELYDQYMKWTDKNLPLSNIRAILISPEFESLMREEADFGDDADYKLITGHVKKILELTDPKEETTTKDEVSETKRALRREEYSPDEDSKNLDEIGKAILKVHDYINKMNNSPIYYGKLDITDVDDIDYLINKIVIFLNHLELENPLYTKLRGYVDELEEYFKNV